MKNTPSFEEFLKEKLQEGHFPFEERHWAGAQKKIAELKEAEKRRKRRIFWLFFGGFLLLGAGFGIWQTMEQEDAVDIMSQPIAQEKASEEKNQESPIELDLESRVGEEAQEAESTLETQKSIASTQVQKEETLLKNVKSRSNQKAAGVSGTEEKVEESIASIPNEKESEVEEAVATGESTAIMRDLELLSLLSALDLPNEITSEAEGKEVGTKDVKLRKPSRWSFDLSLHFGTAALSETFSDVRSAEGKMHLNYRVAPRWQLTSGVGYKYLYGNVPVNAREQVSYGFVATTTRYEWGLDKMHFLTIPFQVEYIPAFGHSIFFGGEANQRLKTSGDLTVYQRTTLEDDAPILSQSDIDYGAALSEWNFGLNFGYDYQFNERMGAGVEYRHGLTYLLNNNFFQSDKSEQASFIGLYLKYKL